MNFIITPLLSFTLLSPAIAQAPVSIENEPRHHLVFQNECVRLFYVRIPPGDTTLFHTHVHDNVGVRLTDAELSDVLPGGNPEKVLVNRGAAGFGHYPTPLTHSVSNVGSTPYHNMLVELLPSKGLPSSAPSLADVPGHTLEIENERVRIFRLVLAPGQSTDEHSHTLQGMRVVITEGKIAVDLPGTKTDIALFKPGDYQWHEGVMRHSLRNVGSATFAAVEIELKRSDSCQTDIVPTQARRLTTRLSGS
jgi:quercetin dioxygenase-like cupin family protein